MDSEMESSDDHCCPVIVCEDLQRLNPDERDDELHYSLVSLMGALNMSPFCSFYPGHGDVTGFHKLLVDALSQFCIDTGVGLVWFRESQIRLEKDALKPLLGLKCQALAFSLLRCKFLLNSPPLAHDCGYLDGLDQCFRATCNAYLYAYHPNDMIDVFGFHGGLDKHGLTKWQLLALSIVMSIHLIRIIGDMSSFEGLVKWSLVSEERWESVLQSYFDDNVILQSIEI